MKHKDDFFKRELTLNLRAEIMEILEKKKQQVHNLFEKRDCVGVELTELKTRGSVSFKNTEEFQCIIETLKEVEHLSHQEAFLDVFSTILSHGAGVVESYKIALTATEAVRAVQEKEDSAHESLLPVGSFTEVSIQGTFQKTSVSFSTEGVNRTYYVSGSVTIEPLD
jgi:hypothetical protein